LLGKNQADGEFPERPMARSPRIAEGLFKAEASVVKVRSNIGQRRRSDKPRFGREDDVIRIYLGVKFLFKYPCKYSRFGFLFHQVC